MVIDRLVTFGNNVKIYQNVTIGNNGKSGIPVIEDNVTIFANSVVVGKIRIGKNSIVRACSFVNRDIPPNSTLGRGFCQANWKYK